MVRLRALWRGGGPHHQQAVLSAILRLRGRARGLRDVRRRLLQPASGRRPHRPYRRPVRAQAGADLHGHPDGPLDRRDGPAAHLHPSRRLGACSARHPAVAARLRRRGGVCRRGDPRRGIRALGTQSLLHGLSPGRDHRRHHAGDADVPGRLRPAGTDLVRLGLARAVPRLGAALLRGALHPQESRRDAGICRCDGARRRAASGGACSPGRASRQEPARIDLRLPLRHRPQRERLYPERLQPELHDEHARHEPHGLARLGDDRDLGWRRVDAAHGRRRRSYRPRPGLSLWRRVRVPVHLPDVRAARHEERRPRHDRPQHRLWRRLQRARQRAGRLPRQPSSRRATASRASP